MSTMPKLTLAGNHAVVLGGSMAGLLANTTAWHRTAKTTRQ